MTSFSNNLIKSPVSSSSSPSSSMETLVNTNRHSDNLTIWSHITASLLASWMKETDCDKKLLIIDSRDTNEHNSFHIRNSINIQDSKIIRKRLKSDKSSINELLLKLDTTSIDLIDNNQNLNIVIYDYNSEHTNQLDLDHSFAVILLKKLVQKKFKSVSFLIGGLCSFQQEYPYLVVSLSTVSNEESSSRPAPPSLTIGELNFNLTTSPTSNLSRMKQFKFNHSLSSYDVDKTSCLKSLNSLTSACGNNMLNSNNNNMHLSLPSKEDINHSIAAAVLTPSVGDLDNNISKSIQSQPITKILDFLYLGSQEDALSQTTMKELNITNVLNVSISCPKAEFISDAHFLRIPVNDGHAAKILPFFDVAFRFIEKCRKANSNVLIHCLAGISRSPTLAIAYLMKHLNLKSDEAYKYVKERRQTISPNFNFLGQLYEYEKQQSQLQKSQLVTDESNNENNSSSDSAALSYLKFTKKIESNSNNNNSNIVNGISQQNESIPTFQQQNNNRVQRKKQFIFRFNDTHSSSAVNTNPTTPTVSQTNNTSTSSVSAATTPNNSSMNPASLLANGISHPKSLLLMQSSTNYSLPSPSQAFSNFNLNSPTTNINYEQSLNNRLQQINKSYTFDSIKEMNSSTSVSSLANVSSCSSAASSQTQQQALTPTSEPFKMSQVVMRRPTNLLMSSGTSSVSQGFKQNLLGLNQNSGSKTPIQPSLKRPSSILLGFGSNNNDSLFMSSSPSSTGTLTSVQLGIPQLNDPNKDPMSNPSGINHMPLTRTLSNTSAGSTSSTCSCSSNLSTSSSSSSIICSSCNSLTPTYLKQQQQLHQQQQLQQQSSQQYQYQKKIKLSPIQDRLVLQSFSLQLPVNSCLPSTSGTTLSQQPFKQQSKLNLAQTPTSVNLNTSTLISMFDPTSIKLNTSNDLSPSQSIMITDTIHSEDNNDENSFLSSKQSIIMNDCRSKLSLNFASSNTATNSASNSANTPLTPNSQNCTIPNLICSFSSRMNQDSQSMASLSSCSSSSFTIQRQRSNTGGANQRRINTNNISIDKDEDEENLINSGDDDTVNMSTNNPKKLLSNSSSLNNILSNNNSNSNHGISKSSSSSSSSKASSNKNSLHGSIETMIEVS